MISQFLRRIGRWVNPGPAARAFEDHAAGSAVDRFQIEDALARYSYGIDQRAWDAWDDLFTPDAILDYSSIGLGRCSPDEFRTRISANDAVRLSGQHLHSNYMFRMLGDQATVGAEYSMVTLSRTERPGVARRVRAGGRCEYDLVRTPGGWRIKGRSTLPKWSERDDIPIPTEDSGPH